MDHDNDGSDLTLEELRQRYEAEAAKRIRTDGMRQWRGLDEVDEALDRDPWADPDAVRAPVEEEVTVVVVGGGFGGMFTAIDLGRQGIRDIRIVEKGADFGGTWYWNRYPGCQCDVESYTYLPLLEETGFMPSQRYAGAPEIFAYCRKIGEHFDLYPQALFQTEVTGAEWDEEASRWHVTTNRGDRLTARFLVVAGGILHKAKLPGIPGIETFGGTAFHTSRWDYSVTGGSPTEPMEKLAGKRVGIIGTGATAVQVVPELAKTAGEVFVFQRTPAAVGVRGQAPTDEAWYRSQAPGWQHERIINFTEAVTGAHPAVDMVDDGWTRALWDDTQRRGATPEEQAELERLDIAVMEGFRHRIDEVVEDPETAAKLKPWWSKHCKRITFHDQYLQAFNRPNVHLVDTDGRGVERITPAGPVVDGVEYPVDILIYASGFEVTTDLARRIGFDPRGHGGTALSERWAEGAHTLHGVFASGFPNLLLISLVQGGFGTNFAHLLAEAAGHVAAIVGICLDEGIETIESTDEAEEAWLLTLLKVGEGNADYFLSCTPSFYNSEKQAIDARAARNLTYTGSLLDFAAHLERWRSDPTHPGVTEIGRASCRERV